LGGVRPGFVSAVQDLTSVASPSSSEWSGPAASAYSTAVNDLISLIGQLEDLDGELAGAIAENATQNADTRYSVYALIGAMVAAVAVAVPLMVDPAVSYVYQMGVVGFAVAGISAAITTFAEEYAVPNGKTVDGLSSSYATVNSQAGEVLSGVTSYVPVASSAPAAASVPVASGTS